MMLKEIPRYECLHEVSKLYPELNPVACEAFLNLIRTSDEMMRVHSEFFNRHNITKGRFIVLMLLCNKSSCMPHPKTPAELADMSVCTRATMTGLIDSLEKDGFVRREPDTDDRRMMKVTLTESGSKFIRDILPEHFRRITYLMGGLSEAEQKTLVSLLGKIVERCVTLEPLSSNQGKKGAAGIS
ncbi:MAG: MarR family transcriptional regulator [Opitutaceae bacterium]|jgi:DNA-binding MarR family transcriptional regulator